MRPSRANENGSDLNSVVSLVSTPDCGVTNLRDWTILCQRTRGESVSRLSRCQPASARCLTRDYPDWRRLFAIRTAKSRQKLKPLSDFVASCAASERMQSSPNSNHAVSANQMNATQRFRLDGPASTPRTRSVSICRCIRLSPWCALGFCLS